jgi:uncharacterized membrane protein
MPESQMRTATGQTDPLFDRYTLPKIALAVILAASLVGAWVSTTLSGVPSVAFAVAKWGYFVAMGVLTGGLVWKHGFVRPADLDTESADYCAAMYDRFDRIATGSVVVLAVGGAAVGWEYAHALDGTGAVVGYGLLVAFTVGSVAASVRQTGSVSARFRSGRGLAALAAALALVVATAMAEVAVRGFEPVAAGVRVLHLLAFAVWLGGAVWNIFVAVPTGQQRPTVGVVRAAGEQLERFRWAVRLIIPTLFLTGLYQAVDVLGTNLEWYLGTPLGLAVLAKVGFVGVLVGIFKLCPMWRACSPIEGVCELDDLGGSADDTSASRESPTGSTTGSSDD